MHLPSSFALVGLSRVAPAARPCIIRCARDVANDGARGLQGHLSSTDAGGAASTGREASETLAGSGERMEIRSTAPCPRLLLPRAPLPRRAQGVGGSANCSWSRDHPARKPRREDQWPFGVPSFLGVSHVICISKQEARGDLNRVATVSPSTCTVVGGGDGEGGDGTGERWDGGGGRGRGGKIDASALCNKTRWRLQRIQEVKSGERSGHANVHLFSIVLYLLGPFRKPCGALRPIAATLRLSRAPGTGRRHELSPCCGNIFCGRCITAERAEGWVIDALEGGPECDRTDLACSRTSCVGLGVTTII